MSSCSTRSSGSCSARALHWPRRASYRMFLGAYTSVCRPRPSCAGWWWPFHSRAFSLDGLRAYARLGLPSTGAECCDWWAWEALTLMAGALNNPAELAGHVAATAASDWLFLAVRGAPKAATVLVGAAAGRGDVAGVRSATRACAACCAALCGALALGIWGSRAGLVAWMLPGDGLAAVVLRRLIPLVVAQMVLDAANSLMDGVFAGLGLQGPASLGTLVCCWVVQQPLAWLLGFHCGLGVVGLRQAALLAALLQTAHKLALLRRSIGGSAPAVARAAGEPQLPVGEYAALCAGA
ncbi:unnamed protein product [Prorocentrum cordatum]|uniref:Protein DETOXIFICATION n=1 Tax=Prorocentrum cordatum TaxID=2364126 RepID=A0ABN9QBW2_9DINO|nr:unnamed protein product [Polarella glacialis]